MEDWIPFQKETSARNHGAFNDLWFQKETTERNHGAFNERNHGALNDLWLWTNDCGNWFKLGLSYDNCNMGGDSGVNMRSYGSCQHEEAFAESSSTDIDIAIWSWRVAIWIKLHSTFETLWGVAVDGVFIVTCQGLELIISWLMSWSIISSCHGKAYLSREVSVELRKKEEDATRSEYHISLVVPFPNRRTRNDKQE
jgi:hypothetical protein